MPSNYIRPDPPRRPQRPQLSPAQAEHYARVRQEARERAARLGALLGRVFGNMQGGVQVLPAQPPPDRPAHGYIQPDQRNVLRRAADRLRRAIEQNPGYRIVEGTLDLLGSPAEYGPGILFPAARRLGALDDIQQAADINRALGAMDDVVRNPEALAALLRRRAERAPQGVDVTDIPQTTQAPRGFLPAQATPDPVPEAAPRRIADRTPRGLPAAARQVTGTAPERVIPLGPVPGADVPGEPAFRRIAQEHHARWKELHGRRRTPDEQQEYEVLDRLLDHRLRASFAAGEPSPLGYQPFWSRLGRAIDEADIEHGTPEEWLAALQRAPAGVSTTEIRDVLPDLLRDARVGAPAPVETPEFQHAVARHLDRMIEKERQTAHRQIESVRANPKIPASRKTQQIERLEARRQMTQPDQEMVKKATQLVQREMTPRISRDDLRRAFERNRYGVRVVMQTQNPLLRELAISPEQRSHALRLNRQLSDERRKLEKLDQEYSTLMRGLPRPRPGPRRDGRYLDAAIEYYAWAPHRGGIDDLLREVRDRAGDEFLTPEHTARIRQAFSVARQRHAQQRTVEDLEAQIPRTDIPPPVFEEYSAPAAVRRGDDQYAEFIYRMDDTLPRPAPRTGDATHFSRAHHPLEIGHVRRTTYGADAYPQEVQGDIPQKIQRGYTAPWKDVPLVHGKHWAELMLRDQMHRAAVEGREGLLVQSPEAVYHVSRNWAPETFYRDVYPHMVHQVARQTGLLAAPPRELKLKTDRLYGHFEEDVRKDIEADQDSYLYSSMDEYEHRRFGIRERIAAELHDMWDPDKHMVQRDIDAQLKQFPASVRDVLIRHRTQPAYITENLEKLLYSYDNDLTRDEIRDYAADWEDLMDRKRYEWVEEQLDDAVEDEIQREIDDAVESETRRRMQEEGIPVGIQRLPADRYVIPEDVRLRLAKEGPFLLGLGGLFGAGAAAGAHRHEHRRAPRGVLDLH